MVQLKLVSDKYDTSQVKLYVDSAFKEIDHRGNCNFKKYNGYQASGSLFIIRMGSLPEILPCTSVIKM